MRLTFKARKQAKLDKISLEFPESKEVRFSAKGKERGKIAFSKKGSTLTGTIARVSSRPMSESFKFSWRGELTVGNATPATPMSKLSVKAKGEHWDGVKDCRMEIPWTSFVLPQQTSPSELASIITGDGCSHLASGRLALQGYTVAEALKAVGPCLGVGLVEAVHFTASYFGRLAMDASPVAVLVKAKKEDPVNINIEVKSCAEVVSLALLAQVTALLSGSSSA